jgi:GDSL-like Lipase/Acylhydrolase family
MAGNNDVDASLPFDAVDANLVAIAGTVHAQRVVLSTIAPEDEVAAAVTDFNARLPELATRQGWQLVDPMAAVGDGHGHYAPGMSDDGVHPTAAAARRIGRRCARPSPADPVPLTAGDDRGPEPSGSGPQRSDAAGLTPTSRAGRGPACGARSSGSRAPARRPW